MIVLNKLLILFLVYKMHIVAKRCTSKDFLFSLFILSIEISLIASVKTVKTNIKEKRGGIATFSLLFYQICKTMSLIHLPSIVSISYYSACFVKTKVTDSTSFGISNPNFTSSGFN